MNTIQTHPYSSSKTYQIKSPDQIQSPMKFKIKAIANGFIISGNYGGSTQFEVFPSEYNYSFYDTTDPKNESNNEIFEELMNHYLVNTMVNNCVSLQEYLELMYQNEYTKLGEIHNQYHEIKPVGNSHQRLAVLFFVDDEKNTVLRLNPFQTHTKTNNHLSNLNLFLQKNAAHFSSKIPDDFFNNHYNNDY